MNYCAYLAAVVSGCLIAEALILIVAPFSASSLRRAWVASPADLHWSDRWCDLVTHGALLGVSLCAQIGLLFFAAYALRYWSSAS